LHDRPPAEAEHAPAGELELSIARVVLLAPARGAVPPLAVGFHDEQMGRPVEVDLLALDVVVGERSGQSMVGAHGEEELLHFTLGHGGLVLDGENRSDLGGTAAAIRARENVLHRAHVEHPLDLGLVDNPLDAAEVEVVGDIEDGARDAGAGDRLDQDDIPREQRGRTVNPNARPSATSSAYYGDVRRPIPPPEFQERGRCVMRAAHLDPHASVAAFALPLAERIG
jgi:hypothetical protein